MEIEWIRKEAATHGVPILRASIARVRMPDCPGADAFYGKLAAALADYVDRLAEERTEAFAGLTRRERASFFAQTLTVSASLTWEDADVFSTLVTFSLSDKTGELRRYRFGQIFERASGLLLSPRTLTHAKLPRGPLEGYLDERGLVLIECRKTDETEEMERVYPLRERKVRRFFGESACNRI